MSIYNTKVALTREQYEHTKCVNTMYVSRDMFSIGPKAFCMVQGSSSPIVCSKIRATLFWFAGPSLHSRGKNLGKDEHTLFCFLVDIH